MNENQTEQNCTKPGKDSVASVIANLADRLAGMSNDTFLRVSNKLRSVARPSVPEPTMDNCKEAQIAGSYPPLFESLNISLRTIEKNLAEMNEYLDRVEL